MNKFLYINRDFNARMTGKRSRKNIFYINFLYNKV